MDGRGTGFKGSEFKKMTYLNLVKYETIDQISVAKWSKFGRRAKISVRPIKSSIDSFHMTCPISRSSETMAECQRALVNNFVDKVAAE